MQKKAHLKDGAPSAEKRIEWLDRAIALLIGHKDAITDALREDFGHRSVEASLFTDVSGSIGPLKHAKAHLKSWMKREKRKVTPADPRPVRRQGLYRVPAQGRDRRDQPVEFPVQSYLHAAGRILAAGNRTMIKPSEFTPRSSELMARMFRSAFDESEVAVSPAGPISAPPSRASPSTICCSPARPRSPIT